MTQELQAWQLVVTVVASFLIGSISPAMVFAQAKGVSLRTVGSGNPGATNAGRAMGSRVGVIVGVLDVLKGLVPVLLFSYWWGSSAAAVAGLAAVFGHIFSPFLNFRGGKGVATTFGALLGVQAIWAIPVLLSFGIVAWATKRIGMGAVAAAVALIACGIWWSPDRPTALFGILLGTLVIVRHAQNIGAAIRDIRAPSAD